MRIATTVLWIGILAATVGSATAVATAQEAATDVTAQLSVGTEWVERNEPISIELSRPLRPDEGRPAVLLDTTDLTDLFLIDGATLTYRPEVVPLPVGERELVIYRVSAQGEWAEIARLPLRVRTRGGFEERSGGFNADVQGHSQFQTDATPVEEAPPEMETGTAQIGLQAGAVRRGWSLSSRASLLGVSEVEQALRFGEDGEDADQLDLAEYSLRLENGRTALELGHVTFGDHRHLIADFASRGLVVAAPLGSAGGFSAAALNGSSVVGWNNFFGLARSEHQVLTGGFGVELIAKRPGALRIDLNYLDGSLLPINDFNQGAVNDAEENEGWGARFSGSTPGQRVAFRAGYARSDFRNPFDRLLAQGEDLVPVLPEERDARYLDVDFALVRGKQLKEGWDASVQLGLRHERIEPQYRTVGAFLQADREQDGAELAATVGPISVQAGHSRAEDNLDDIESILKTKTRTSQLNVGVPLAMAFPSEPRPWLPTVTIGLARTRQFAANQPVNSDFNTTNQLPDQVSLNQTASLDWQGNRWQFGYSWNLSDQDNRQPGRDLDDFENTSQALRFSFAPHPRLDLGLDYSWDRALSLAAPRTDRNERAGLNLLWRTTDAMSWSGRYSLTETEDDPRTSTSESTVLDLEWAYRLAWRADRKHGGSAQLFLRYAAQDFESEDQVFLFEIARDSWTLNAGVNLSFR